MNKWHWIAIAIGLIGVPYFLLCRKLENIWAREMSCQTPRTVTRKSKRHSLYVAGWLVAVAIPLIVAVGMSANNHEQPVRAQPVEYVEMEMTSTPPVRVELTEYVPPVVRLPIDFQALHWAIGQVEGGPAIGPNGERGRCQWTEATWNWVIESTGGDVSKYPWETHADDETVCLMVMMASIGLHECTTAEDYIEVHHPDDPEYKQRVLNLMRVYRKGQE